MEESERTVNCDISDKIEIKDFSNELVDLPQVLEYIQKLQEQVRLQENELNELKNEFSKKKKQSKTPEIKLVDAETQTDIQKSEEEWIAQEWSTGNEESATSLVDQVKEVAESAMLQTGFVYEETTGLYYHYESGYYYDAKSGLYYNGNTGTYYYYDKESKSYKFHSHIQRETSNAPGHTLLNKKKKGKKSREKNKARIKKIKLMPGEEENEDTQPEKYQCLDSDGSCSSKDDISTSSSSNDNEIDKEEDTVKVYPPCMRIIVKETNLPNLKIGSLFIVPCTGGSIGREGEHSVTIQDINISKYHAKLQYNETKKLYEITDLGSRNGTLLNGKRLSVAKQESEPTEIVHGSILQLGSTKLLCHIHNGHETCGHCEPGLVQLDPAIEENVSSGKKKHQSELKRLKSKFGLEQSNIDSASRVADGYQDRAQSRREHVGSSTQFAKTQQSSLNESISKDNMGFKMLSKMGWSEGSSLGKSGDGLTEPMPLVQTAKNAGLGTGDGQVNIEIDPAVEKKQAIWRKTQQRYNDITE